MRPPSRHMLRPIEEYTEFEEENSLRIDRSLWPDGFALQWVTHSVYNQVQPQHRARFERQGWVSIMAHEFEGRYGRMFCPDGYEGEIMMDGLVLMARPQAWSDRAKALEQRRARERVQIKERQLLSGDLSRVTLASDHPTAVRSNLINRSLEPIAVPQQ